MKDYYGILSIVIGIILGNLFQEQAQSFQHYDVLCPFIFSLTFAAIVYKKWKVFKQRTFIKAKYDGIRRGVGIAVGVLIVILVLYYWMPNSFFHWTILALGGIATIFNYVFYESTIQLYLKNQELYIQYGNSSYYSFVKIESYSIQNGILKIHFDDTRIEVYNVKMTQLNIEKLSLYLDDFQNSRIPTS